MILDHRIADVDTPACPDIFIEFRLLERNGRDHRIGLLSLNQIHLEVFPFGTDQPRIAPVAHIPCDEYRRGIARAERLETGQRRAEMGRDIAEEQFRIDIYLRDKHFRIDVLLDIVVEALREHLDVFGLHRHTRRIHVSAEIFEQVGA